MANRLVSVSLGQLRAQADSIDATLLAELERAGLIEQRGGKWCCTERGHNFAPRYMAMRHGRWCIDGPIITTFRRSFVCVRSSVRQRREAVGKEIRLLTKPRSFEVVPRRG